MAPTFSHARALGAMAEAACETLLCLLAHRGERGFPKEFLNNPKEPAWALTPPFTYTNIRDSTRFACLIVCSVPCLLA